MNTYYVECFVGNTYKSYMLDATSLAMLEGIVSRIQYNKSKSISIELVQRADH